MRKRFKTALPVVLAAVVLAAACLPLARELIRLGYGPPRETVPGTEEVHVGSVADRGMAYDWNEADKNPFAQSRAYIGVAFDGGGGETFWLADRCEEAERAHPGDRVRIETAIEEYTDFRVATKITVLEKISE